ncbi:MAG TPA: OmpA family protein [Bryobacteraceae bacterium]|nr:OmpA family protein [Bryobacteraceae bacterium]
MTSRYLACAAVTALALTFAGCSKKVVAKAPQTPAPQATEPHAVFTPAPAPARSQPSQATPAPASRYPTAAERVKIQELLNRIQDAYFDYNKHTLRPDAETTLKTDAQTLADIIKQYPDFKLTVEGFCDERGSDEYNIALGDARAKQTKEYLSNLGLPGNQLATISYGKEKPVCTDHDEACWQRNRRTHITQAQAN